VQWQSDDLACKNKGLTTFTTYIKDAKNGSSSEIPVSEPALA